MRQESALTHTSTMYQVPITSLLVRTLPGTYKIYLPGYHSSGFMSLLYVKFAGLMSRLSCIVITLSHCDCDLAASARDFRLNASIP